MEIPKTKTRDQLLDELKQYKETGKNMPFVRDHEILKTGDVLHFVDPFGGPTVRNFFLLGKELKTDENGTEKTYLQGYETTTRDYSEFVNNPQKMHEYAALSGLRAQSLHDLSRLTVAMSTEPLAFEDPDMPIVEYEVSAVGLSPLEDGSFTHLSSTFLAEAAE